MSEHLSIAVDAMGGDFGPRVTVPACINLLKQQRQLTILLVGDKAQIEPLLSRCPAYLSSRITLVHTTSVITMNDKPSYALRNLQDSSMYLALGLVRDGKASACVSAGNTGALMVLGCSLLRTSGYRSSGYYQCHSYTAGSLLPAGSGGECELQCGAFVAVRSDGLSHGVRR